MMSVLDIKIEATGKFINLKMNAVLTTSVY